MNEACPHVEKLPKGITTNKRISKCRTFNDMVRFTDDIGPGTQRRKCERLNPDL